MQFEGGKLISYYQAQRNNNLSDNLDCSGLKEGGDWVLRTFYKLKEEKGEFAPYN